MQLESAGTYLPFMFTLLVIEVHCCHNAALVFATICVLDIYCQVNRYFGQRPITAFLWTSSYHTNADNGGRAEICQLVQQSRNADSPQSCREMSS